MKNPIKILQVVTQMNRGGLETMLMNYYRQMDRNEIQFDFLTHRPAEEKKDYDKEIEDLGGKIYHLPRLNPFSPSYKTALRTFFSEHPEYKIIHVHQDCLSGVILKIAKQCGIPVRIAHCHNSSQDKNAKYLVKLMFKNYIRKYATDMFACGVASGKWMFGDSADFKVLPNAINTANYEYNPEKRISVRRQLGIEPSTVVIGLVARFSKVKNQEFLVNAFDYVHRKQPDSKLIFVGRGDTMEDVRRLVDVKNLANDVLFLGVRSDVNDILQAFDFFVMPSLFEGLPVSIIEAQCSGLTCLISDGVPVECKVTDLVQQLPLDKGPEFWGQKILKEVGYQRKQMASIIAKAGFDIKVNGQYLCDFYLRRLPK